MAIEKEPEKVEVEKTELQKLLEPMADKCWKDKFKFYLPTAYGTKEDVVRETIDRLARVFKGGTVYTQAEGYWCEKEDEKKRCILVDKEPVVVFEAYHGCLSKEQAQEIVDIILDYGKKAEQTAIAVVENTFFLIPMKED